MYDITKKKFRKPCNKCGKKFFFISQNGNCKKCLADTIDFARLQMKQKEGPVWEKYKKKLMESLNK